MTDSITDEMFREWNRRIMAACEDPNNTEDDLRRAITQPIVVTYEQYLRIRRECDVFVRTKDDLAPDSLFRGTILGMPVYLEGEEPDVRST